MVYRYILQRKDETNNLVYDGRAVNFDVKQGVNVDSLGKALFPKYDHWALGQVDIYISCDDQSDENSKGNQWKEVPGSELLLSSQDGERAGAGGEDPVKKVVYGILDHSGDHDQSRPTKRRKIRDASENTEVQSYQCTDLDTCGLKILTLTDADAADTVRYFGRNGMADVFAQLVDSRESQTNFNVEFIGAPGTGKSNLVWAAAEHLAANKGEDVLWVSRRSQSEDWTVIQFKKEGFFSFTDVPKKLSDILKSPDFADTSVLIISAPISIEDESQREQGAAAYAWANHTGFHRSRIGRRRVIHVSSLGASTDKAEQRRQLSIHEITISPWTRQDLIKAVADPQLKKKACETMGISDPSSISSEDLVDQKFYYSGINARWFFNHDIATIKAECHLIV